MAPRRVLIRGLEAGSAYLAYLLRESGVEVDVLTANPSDPLLDVPPFEPLFTLDFLRDVLAVRFVEQASGNYDAVVDSCDVFKFEEVKGALSGDKPVYIVGDSWLSASLSLYRSLPVPDVDIDLPVEKTGEFLEVQVRYRPYVGGNYSLCGGFRDAWGGCLYTPMRALERVFAAADVYASMMGLEAPGRRLRLEYAVGRDRFYAAVGCRPEGKVSKINIGDAQVWIYGEGGAPRYIFFQGRPEHAPWFFSMYNLARAVNSAYLYDFALRGRGGLNLAYVGHLFRELRG
ncbi:MAG: hypothetical protein ACPL3C_12455 [Pyrobaculum sp.]